MDANAHRTDAGEARVRLAADHQALGLPSQRNNKVLHATNMAHGKKKIKALKVSHLAELALSKKSLEITNHQNIIYTLGKSGDR